MTVSNNELRGVEESIRPSDGSEIHVSQDGPREAPALLLIHGTAASGRSWDPMVLLAGVGHSPNLEDPPRTAAQLLAFAAKHAAPQSN